MGWRSDEVWLDSDVLWFREQPRRPFRGLAQVAPAFAPAGMAPPWSTPGANGLEASRARRQQWQAERRRRLATRTVPAVALVVGSATMLPMYVSRQLSGGREGPLAADPPSLTFRFDQTLETLESPVPRAAGAARARAREQARATTAVRARASRVVATPEIAWNRASAQGLPYAGSLSDGTQLPIEGPDWVTWNPNTDSVPNLPRRLYAHERTIRTVLSVVAAYRADHPDAPRVVIGDLSLRGGGVMDQHRSHQNGLDVDVYYPRLDHALTEPTSPSQVDRRLAQDLLDRFVAAGAQMVFVGYETDLHGPAGVVTPYPSHENHMHVRFPPPPA